MKERCHLFYKAIIAYDGTDYKGWQHQTHKQSIADKLEHAFKQAFKHAIKIKGASRTDAGVHALGQVVSFVSHVAVEPIRLQAIWNSNLPTSLSIESLERTQELFNPRDNVLSKEYHYTIYTERPTFYRSRFGYFTKTTPDQNLFKKALTLFVGTHDFGSFCKTPAVGTTIRTIDSIECKYDTAEYSYKIIIKGKSFLHNMIRRIVGACLQVAQAQKSLQSIMDALSCPNPMQEFLNAPAAGLMLYTIVYKSKDHA